MNIMILLCIWGIMKNLKFFLYKTKMLSKLKIEIFSLRYAKNVENSERKIYKFKIL